MSVNPDPSVAGDEHDPVATKQVANWLNQLIRTLKTCRLYDSNNPTVVRFREDLAQELRSLLERHGEITLGVTTHALHYREQQVFTPSSREDNLAATFHRDGIRSLTLMPGIEPREVELLLDHLLLVTGPAKTDDDLVTLLWEANLPSITLKAVPIEGDIDGGGDDDGEGDDGAASMPWPKHADAAAAGRPASGEPQGDAASRSDDWTSTDQSVDLEAVYRNLMGRAPADVERFQGECRMEQASDLLESTATAMDECLATDLTEDDRREFARFLPRVLREALGAGDWRTARRTLQHLMSCDAWWSADSFFAGLTGTSAVITRRAVVALDGQGDEAIGDFMTLAGELGPASVEWLMLLLTESQQKRVRRPLAQKIAGLVEAQPERVVPWLTDERWYVVRNVVHILGWIGGNRIAPYLKTAADHPEERVRREVVAALSQAEGAFARPILVEMLPLAEPRLFTAILHQLSLDGEPEVSKVLIELLDQEAFEHRGDQEKRAVYMALSTRGNEVLGALESQLHKGGLFARGLDAHWQTVARCIRRIGTPEALAILERGKRASKGGIRKACELALAAPEASSHAA